MNLYCERCDAIHRFGIAKMERLIYVLTANISDMKNDTSSIQFMRATYCLNQWEGESGDVEMYAEHVQATVESRKRLEKEVRPLLAPA